MAQETYTKAEKDAEWEAEGEDSVRTKFEMGHFGSAGDKRALAKMWLDKRDQERKDASQAESFALANSANDAAWEAARAAKTANTIATLALAAAVIAIAISIVSTFLA